MFYIKALIEGLETFRLLLFINFRNIHGVIKILLFETFIVVLKLYKNQKSFFLVLFFNTSIYDI